ncbi:MAG: glycosyltransferase family 39 protein [Candidatus Eisenbacteria bacterium]|nr:glycosyltransferase family 39 protein [Candidatus Eisenbacteria bacterium]
MRLFRLGHQSLWIDEQFTLLAAGVPGPFDPRALLENVHGPLHAAVVAAFAAVGGLSETTLRLPSALAGIALVPVMAWLAARFAGRETAAPAAWLTAGAPFAIWYSQECRNYIFLILASAVATGLLLGLHERVRARGVAGYALAAAAGLLSNFSFAFLAPLHLKWWLQAGPTQTARRRTLAIVALVAALAALPWLPAIGGIWDWSRLVPGRSAGAGETALRGEHTFHAAAVPFALHAFVMGYSGGPSLRELRTSPEQAVRSHAPELALAALVFGFLGVCGVRALARRGRLADTLLALVAPALVVSYFAANNFKVFHPRYLAAAWPLVVLGLAAAFADLGPRARRVMTVAVVVLWAGAYARVTFQPEYGREDYRTALHHVRAGLAAGERVIAVGAPEPVEWYGRGLPVQRFWLGYTSNDARFARAWRDSVGQVPPGIWLVASRTEDLDPTGSLARRLDRVTSVADRDTFAGVRVWHLREHDPAGVVVTGDPPVNGAPH